jgi:hydrogenase maturation protease
MEQLLENVLPKRAESRAALHPERWLFYGIGNIGRQDDGLGIRLIENLELLNLPPHIELQSNYQLNVEDALEISNYDVVVFVDATVTAKSAGPFFISRIEPSPGIAFSTHAMSMEGILALSDQLYGKAPQAFVLTMPGFQWEVIDELSTEAQANLELTTACLRSFLTDHFKCG